MDAYTKSMEVRWSDLDPNSHMTHSKFYELGAYIRMCFFVENGITESELKQHRIGPILLREECQFRKEIHFGDKVSIDLHITKARQDFFRWSISHTITANGIFSALIQVDGAWINLDRRKLTHPPQSFVDIFLTMPRSNDFQWL